MKQIALNLVSGVSCTIRANDGVHCAYNILDAPPPEVPPERICGTITAHYHKIRPRDIFGGFRE